MAATALLTVVIAILFRQGGVDARFIIQTFGTFATIGTVPRIVLWAAARITRRQDEIDPSGTDLVLVAGGLIAIIWSAVQGLKADFAGTRGEQSLISHWGRYSFSKFFRKRLPRLFPLKEETVEETREAAIARLELEKKQSLHGAEIQK
jgi:hypothetical protein